MPAKTYRWSGNHLPVTTASAAIASGALVFQEGMFGVAITGAASGASLMIETKGVHLLTVPAGSAKGDKLHAVLSGESVAVALVVPGTGIPVGLQVGDRDPVTGKALVLLRDQPFTVAV